MLENCDVSVLNALQAAGTVPSVRGTTAPRNAYTWQLIIMVMCMAYPYTLAGHLFWPVHPGTPPPDCGT